MKQWFAHVTSCAKKCCKCLSHWDVLFENSRKTLLPLKSKVRDSLRDTFVALAYVFISCL